MSGASSLLRIASRRSSQLSSLSSRTFQNATAATLSSSNTNESTTTNLHGSIATALALVSGLSLLGSDRKKKADCAAIAAVVGKDEFDARYVNLICMCPYQVGGYRII